jgi:predicted nucleic acid-binding protein
VSYLIDTNVLIAAGWNVHANYAVANAWLGRQAEFATCSSVQCGFLRVSLSPAIGADFAQAQVALGQIISLPAHRLVLDDIPAATLPAVTGHKEVMDAHLICLARRHGLKLATLDKPLCSKAWAAGIAEFIG